MRGRLVNNLFPVQGFIVSYQFRDLSVKDLIEQFGLKPGPIIGELLDIVREAQAEGKVNTKEEAILFIGNRVAHGQVEEYRIKKALNLLKNKMKPNSTWKIERPIRNLIIPIGNKNYGNEFITQRAREVIDYYKK